MRTWLLAIVGQILFLTTPTTYAQELSGVTSFAYQLQNLDLDQLAASPYQLVVIDYSADGSDLTAFSADQIAALRNSGKIVLAYLSIGEAEDYRFYFKRRWIRRQRGAVCRTEITDAAPIWLDRPNRNWCGNYKTRYWSARWQRIIFGVPDGARKSYLDRILDAGFDGVYLDIIDGFEYWKSRVGPARRVTLASDMASFVEGLGNYARTIRGRPNFIVVPQNGASILEELSDVERASYLAAIQGIGAEDTFYFGDLDEDNELNVQQYTVDLLAQFRDAGKAVLAIDYLADAAKIADFQTRSCALGFIPQVSVRNLDTLSAHSAFICP